MKLFKIFIVCFLLLVISCKNEINKEKGGAKYYKTTNDRLNDSTIESSNWVDSLNADCYLIRKMDTLDRYKYSKYESYFNYTHFNSNGSIYKINQYVYLANELRLNEIIYFNSDGSIDEANSFYLEVKEQNDSIKIISHPLNYFNKTILYFGESTSFDTTHWIVDKTINSNFNYILIPKKINNMKYLLQAIRTNEKGQDESGKDFYFDVNNLIGRDINNSLVSNKE